MYKVCKITHRVSYYVSSLCIFLGTKPNEIDVVFLLGASNPGGKQHILNEQRLVEEIVQRNNTPASRFAIVLYEDTATVQQSLNEYANAKTFIDILKSLNWKNEGANLNSGLAKVKMLFEKEGRPKARKTLVVFSDGQFATEIEGIKKLKKPLVDQGVKIIPVTVGDNVDEDKFNELSSKNQTLRHDDSEDPKNTADKIQEELMKGC